MLLFVLRPLKAYAGVWLFPLLARTLAPCFLSPCFTPVVFGVWPWFGQSLTNCPRCLPPRFFMGHSSIKFIGATAHFSFVCLSPSVSSFFHHLRWDWVHPSVPEPSPCPGRSAGFGSPLRASIRTSRPRFRYRFSIVSLALPLSVAAILHTSPYYRPTGSLGCLTGFRFFFAPSGFLLRFLPVWVPSSHPSEFRPCALVPHLRPGFPCPPFTFFVFVCPVPSVLYLFVPPHSHFLPPVPRRRPERALVRVAADSALVLTRRCGRGRRPRVSAVSQIMGETCTHQGSYMCRPLVTSSHDAHAQCVTPGRAWPQTPAPRECYNEHVGARGAGSPLLSTLEVTAETLEA